VDELFSLTRARSMCYTLRFSLGAWVTPATVSMPPAAQAIILMEIYGV
jgi:hypothetical protein